MSATSRTSNKRVKTQRVDNPVPEAAIPAPIDTVPEKEQPSSDELGPHCPRCGGSRWGVYRSTKNERAWIRKRKCRHCGYTFVSIESGPPPAEN